MCMCFYIHQPGTGVSPWLMCSWQQAWADDLPGETRWLDLRLPPLQPSHRSPGVASDPPVKEMFTDKILEQFKTISGNLTTLLNSISNVTYGFLDGTVRVCGCHGNGLQGLCWRRQEALHTVGRKMGDSDECIVINKATQKFDISIHY